MGEEWRGGDVARFAGGGHKINMLVRDLAPYKDDKELVIMFTDSYDVVLLAGQDTILSKFSDFESSLVFSAEGFCWPDKSLADQYPRVILGKRYLCSGGYIGFAPVIYEALSSAAIEDIGDDQLFFTKLYLDKEFRDKHNMKLDHRSHLFQNLNGAEEDVEVKYGESKSWIENIVYGTEPVMIHGNGASKLRLNQLGSYVPDRWTNDKGCITCDADTFSLLGSDESDYPEVLLAIFSIKPSPFFGRFLERLAELNYPQSRISIRLYVQDEYHLKAAESWLEEARGAGYKNISFISPDSSLTDTEAYNDGIRACIASDCTNYFAVESSAMLINRDSLRLLVEQNRTFLAPLIVRHEKLWSNFWGALSEQGFYARSDDYIDIVKGEKVGIWNVPYVSSVYLIKGHILKQHPLSYTSSVLDPDMAFCESVRSEGVFMYVTNRDYFGRLLEIDSYSTDRLHNDMYEILNNQADWEELYIHPNYSDNLNQSVPVDMPCPDVYYFPLISEKFANELVEEMEHFGQWSAGKDSHQDSRLSGGYENVPTVDIHANQIGFEEQWLQVIKSYVLPVQERVFPGYYSHAHSVMNFVVKYNPNGQFLLRPHHDSSTFTINVALSRSGIDYEGGGCRFIRYNCSVRDAPVGHTLMHPGRLTHWHEGLTVTGGTRYIMISFIDP